MTSTRERQQRAAARARLAREMTERQEAARRRRQRNAMLGAATALVLVVGAVIWAVTAFSGDDGAETPPVASDLEPGEGAGSDECVWLPEDAGGNPHLRDVGTPPPGEPREGVQTMTITTNHGVIEVEMDTAAAPCTAASFTHLAANEFYDGSICHRLVTEGIFVLQCGDPSGTGMGGPAYKYAEENLPAGEVPTYPKGTVAMAKTAAPSTTGSQFFIVYEDTELPPEYTVVGMVAEGLEIVETVAGDGASNEAGDAVTDGAPNTEVTIETLRVSDPA